MLTTLRALNDHYSTLATILPMQLLFQSFIRFDLFCYLKKLIMPAVQRTRRPPCSSLSDQVTTTQTWASMALVILAITLTMVTTAPLAARSHTAVATSVDVTEVVLAKLADVMSTLPLLLHSGSYTLGHSLVPCILGWHHSLAILPSCRCHLHHCHLRTR